MQRKLFISLAVFFVFVLLGTAETVITKMIGTLEEQPAARKTVTITIPEGWTVHQINEKLASEGILPYGSVPGDREGYLFPDTYEFYVPSTQREVLAKFEEAFNEKVGPVLPQGEEGRRAMIIASLIEKEVPHPEDRRIVAGIIEKRLEVGMRLQIDATICYLKEPEPCEPITDTDRATDSPFNTYRVKGLPPAPISNPGLDAITAALEPERSPYRFYISEPETGKTIFAVDLEEHNKNIAIYLK